MTHGLSRHAEIAVPFDARLCSPSGASVRGRGAKLSTSGWVRASYHMFGMFDGPVDIETGIHGIENGLVQETAPGCCLIRTGVHSGQVHLTVDILDQEPDSIAFTAGSQPWDEIIEVSVSAPSGELRIGDLDYLGSKDYPVLSPGGPGSYRVRVQAVGRDYNPDESVPQSRERYLISVWPAPSAREWIVRATDKSGAEMRKYAAEFTPPDPAHTSPEPTSRPPAPASDHEAAEYLRRRGGRATAGPVAAPDPANSTSRYDDWISE